MNKEQIEKMIQENLQMISILESQVRVLRGLVGENYSTPPVSPINVSQQIESYRQKIMADLMSQMPNNQGIGNNFGSNMPSHFRSMENKFEQMKKEVESVIKE